MKVVNDLLGYKNLKIIQDSDYFCFSLDSVLLARFVTINKRCKKIIDLGCGNAPMPLIISTRTNAKIEGIEIQKEISDIAIESVNINTLSNQIEIKNEDIRNIRKFYESDICDTIVCNPPYFKYYEKTYQNKNNVKSNARHENTITLEEIVLTAKKILKNNGNIAVVLCTERFLELVNLLEKNNIRVKKIQFVHPKNSKESNVVLVEGVKNGKPGVKVLPPVIVHDNDGKYSKYVLNMFE